VADALSRRYALVLALSIKLLGFKHLKDLYTNDHDFSNVYTDCENVMIGFCSRKENYVCPLVLLESFGIEKILNILQEHFF